MPSKVTARVRRKSVTTEEKMASTAASDRRQRSPEDDQDTTVRNLERTASSYLNGTANEKRSSFASNNDGEEQMKGSQEDLFLVLARSNSLADDAKEAKGERRRVSVGSCCRFSLLFQLLSSIKFLSNTSTKLAFHTN